VLALIETIFDSWLWRPASANAHQAGLVRPIFLSICAFSPWLARLVTTTWRRELKPTQASPRVVKLIGKELMSHAYGSSRAFLNASCCPNAGRTISRLSTDNDQAATLEIPAQAGDLVLRDRGYFRIQAIEEHKRAGADSINRYKHYTALYDPATGQKINLLELLTLNGSVDMLVGAGLEQTVHLRLIAVPAPEETANLRRMKAKKEMNGHAPSQELLRLMSWTIFLTTITDPSITFKEILALYGLRWRIESIFKTWKSYFNFQKVHNVPEIQLRVLLNARLIMITLAYERLFIPLLGQVYKASGKLVSLIKFTRYITQNLALLPRLLNSPSLPPQLCRALQRYCTYEKRNRANFMTEMEAILLKTGASWD